MSFFFFSCSQAFLHPLLRNSPNRLMTKASSTKLSIYSYFTTLLVLKKIFTMCKTSSTYLDGLDILFSCCFVSFMHALVSGYFSVSNAFPGNFTGMFLLRARINCHLKSLLIFHIDRIGFSDVGF